jgi:thiol-disulfide isomerase/thioredoxin
MADPRSSSESPVVRLLESSFRGTALTEPGVWAVEFVADWCPFCQEFAPKFAALAGRGFHLARADVTSSGSPLWERFHIDVIPTVLVFRDGAIIHRADGRYGEGLDEGDLASIERAARDAADRA